MSHLTELKQFVFDGMLASNALHSLSQEGISIDGEAPPIITKNGDELEFSLKTAYQAGVMAEVYRVFFCLENAVRDLISSRLLERKGYEWWSFVPDKVKKNVEKLKAEEAKHRYHAPRSAEFIGYTMFGNLCQIIIANWDEFSDIFPDQHWVNSRFSDLEKSRNIIMHTGILPQLEVERIHSIARDWLRQAG